MNTIFLHKLPPVHWTLVLSLSLLCFELKAETAVSVHSPTLGGHAILLEKPGTRFISIPLQKQAVASGIVAEVSAQQGGAQMIYLEEDIHPESAFSAHRLEDGSTLLPQYYLVKTGVPSSPRIPILSNGPTFIQTMVAHPFTVGDEIEIHAYHTLVEIVGGILQSYSTVSEPFWGDAVFRLQAEQDQARLMEGADAYTLENGVWKKWKGEGLVAGNTFGQQALDDREVPALAVRRTEEGDSRWLVILGEPLLPLREIQIPQRVAGQIIEVPYVVPGSDPVALQDLEFSFTPALYSAGREDELGVPAEGRGNLITDAKTYFSLDDGTTGAWRLLGDETTDVGAELLHPGQVYILRRR